MNILAHVTQFVKEHRTEIVLSTAVVLISLASFAIGYLVARDQFKESIRIEKVETL